MHKSFLPDVKLPYKIVVDRAGIYIGNFDLTFKEICKKKYDKFGTLEFCKFLARLQANVEYLSWSIGYKKRPLLILDQPFFKKLGENNFTPVG